MITQDELKERIHYDPETGIFTWLKARPKVLAREKCGSIDKGFLTIYLEKGYYAHHLAWIYMTGEFPKDAYILFKDNDKLNLKFSNLVYYPRLKLKKHADLTKEQLQLMLNYDPETGDFEWNFKINQAKKAGICNDEGYITIRIAGKKFQASRLAWLYMTGNHPEHEVDHIDKNPSNNKWKNLREATHLQNSGNRKIRGTNKTGHRGVYEAKNGRFQVSITHNHIHHHLGVFDTKLEAALAYEEKAKELRGGFFEPILSIQALE